MKNQEIKQLIDDNILSKTGQKKSLSNELLGETIEQISGILLNTLTMSSIVLVGDTPGVIIEKSPLTIGESYTIQQYQGGDDFTNVGALDNMPYLQFVATGTTPAVWTNGTKLEYTAVYHDIIYNGTNAKLTVSFDKETREWFLTSDIDLFFKDKVFIQYSGYIASENLISARVIKFSSYGVAYGFSIYIIK